MTVTTSTAERLGSHSELYGEVLDWLIDEAALLDDGRLTDWLALLDPEVTYRVPVRDIRSRFGAREDRPSTGGFYHFDETRASLEARVLRVAEPTAWAEDPAAATRHLVSNLRLNRLDSGELVADSYLVLLRHRGHQTDYEVLSGERHDRFRRRADGRLALVSREVVLDRSSLAMVNLAVFL
jgi:3-phenylpropionate/cinnamic acid dioxygenase small subunit